MERKCFLFGDRDAPESTVEEVENMIVYLFSVFDVRIFIIGQYGEFQETAELAVKLAKERCPDMIVQYLPPNRFGRLKLAKDWIDGLLLCICYVRKAGEAGKIYNKLVRRGVIPLNLAKFSSKDLHKKRPLY